MGIPKKLRIASGGNVGIGTQNPAVALQVSGTVSGVSGIFDDLTVDLLNVATGIFDYLVADTGIFSDSVSGVTGLFDKVGIGTTVPTTHLEVSGGNILVVGAHTIAPAINLNSNRLDDYLGIVQWDLRGAPQVQMGWGQNGGSQGDFQLGLLGDNDFIITGAMLALIRPELERGLTGIQFPPFQAFPYGVTYG